MDKQEYGKVIAKNLRKIMYDTGKTQADVAKDLKISKATLSSWMNGTRIPRMPNIDMLCHYFNVSRSDIMEEHDTVQIIGHQKEYYEDPETARLAQEMFEDKDMRMLFDMKKNMTPERFARQMETFRDMYRLEHPEEFPEDWMD